MTDIKKLLESESRWLAQQEIEALRKMMQVYESTFDELQHRLKRYEPGSYTANHYQAINAQLRVLMEEGARQQSAALGATVSKTFERQLGREKNYWSQLEKTFGQPDLARQFERFTPLVNQRAIRALVMTQDISIKNFSDQLTNRTRLAVAQGVAMGEGIEATMRRLRHIEGMPANRSRLQLIARMETARSANEAKNEYLTQVQDEYPELDLWQMVRDSIDKGAKTRNHWFSWAVGGTVRNISQGEYFEVHNGAIAQARLEYSQITRKKTYDNGILFERFAQGRRGKTIPAHYRDRAVLIGWRPSWGQQFGAVKHPQGPIPGMGDQKPRIPPPPPPPRPAPAPARPRPGRKLKPDPTRIESLREASGAEVRQVFKAQVPRAQALDRTRQELLTKLEANPNMDDYGLLVENYGEIKQLNSQAHARLIAPVAGQAKFNNRIRFGEGIAENLFELEVDDGQKFLNAMMGPGPLDKLPAVQVLRDKKSRASYVDNKIMLGPDVIPGRAGAAMVHEAAHWLEENHPPALEAVVAFWERRTAGERDQSLRRLTGRNYKDHELTKKDQFISPYMGKIYYSNPRPRGASWQQPYGSNDRITHTELVSMGLELMYSNPIKFMDDDPDYFDLIWGIVQTLNA